MNIEQIQARIQNYPIPLLQQYANGSNPEVPGWLALSVLQQKEAMGRQVANSQGAAQGQMPTVKQQLDQKLGTMQQQASMQPQGLAQAQVPPPEGPVQGEPMQAAAGGLMSGNAGSSMKFAQGGIIGYDGEDGSYVSEDVPGALPRTPLSRFGSYLGQLGEKAAHSLRAKRVEGMRFDSEDEPDRKETVAPATKQDELARLYKAQLAAGVTANGAKKQIPPSNQGLGAARPAAPAVPAAAPAPAPESIEAMLRAGLANRPEAPTVEGTAGTVKGMQQQFGVDQPAGAEERALIAQMNQRYAQSKEGQGLRNLQSVLAASGRGYGAMGQEDVRLHNAETAADMAHQKAVYELTHGINTANRAEQVGAMNKGLGMYGEKEKAGAEFDKSKLTTLASMYHTKEAAAAQLLAARIAQLGKTDPAESMRLKYLDQQQDSLVSELNKLPQFGIGVKEKRAAIEAKLSQIRRELQKATGIDIMAPAPSATGAGGPPPPGAVREVKR